MPILPGLLPPKGGGENAVLGALLLLLQGCTANGEPGGTGQAPVPLVTAQRVTGTIQREASRLVRLETERESFLTTPEHPFATPGSGWISAGRLVPGQWVVSERLGAVRLLAVRSEPVAGPVPVFNLSVASSHAYFVGTDRVLVHNTKCTAGPSESREATVERLTREQEELSREIEALKQTAPSSPRIAELKRRRRRVQWQTRMFRETYAERVERLQLRARERERLLAATPAARGSAVQEAERPAVQGSAGADADPRVREERMRKLRAERDLRRKRARRDRQGGLADGRDASEIERQLEEFGRERRALEVERLTQKTAELGRQIAALTKTAPTSPRIAELKFQLKSRQIRLGKLRAEQRRAQNASLPTAVRDEADDVDETLREREAVMGQHPSPERAAELESSSARLEQELREERAAVEVAISALANEQASIQASQAGSSRGPSWQERVRALQELQAHLRARWRAGLEERLDSARQRLNVRRAVFALRDEAVEEALGREIALLERHLQTAS